jgi:hypothetical protein
MDDTSTTTDTLDQAEVDILTSTVSDEALEAAADTVRVGPTAPVPQHPHCHPRPG